MADGTFEPVTGAPAGLNASSRPPFRLSRAAPDGLRPSGQAEGERPPQVDGGAHRLQLDVVTRQPEVAHPAVAVDPLHGPEQPLDPGPDRRDRLVERHLPGLERPVAPRLVHDPRLDTARPEPGPPRLAVVRFVGVQPRARSIRAGWSAGPHQPPHRRRAGARRARLPEPDA